MIIVVVFVGDLSLESQEKGLERECGGGFLDCVRFVDIVVLSLNFDGFFFLSYLFLLTLTLILVLIFFVNL